MKNKYKLLHVLIFLLLGLFTSISNGQAESVVGDQMQVLRYTSSQFKPPEASDSTFVVNSGLDLDTGCTYESGGPLVIELPIDRYFGTAEEIEQLRANKLLPDFAELILPAYDVDYYSGSSTIRPERDRLLFNGKFLKGNEYLRGENGRWVMNQFNIPIDWIKFPTTDFSGGIVPSINKIKIEIDVDNPGQDIWCTAVDWIALEFPVVRPVLLVHGINPWTAGKSPADSWKTQWVNGLSNAGIPVETIDLSVGYFALESIETNAYKIGLKVEEMKAKYGVDKINIVAHSKGGLDSREFAEHNDSIDRLIQIGTPNVGSPIADVLQTGLTAASIKLKLPLKDILNWALPAGKQLTVDYMRKYNQFAGHNDNTKYYALAGNYKYGTYMDRLFSVFLGGDSDLVVPVWSVHGLDYLTRYDYESVETIKQAQHTKQIGSADIFKELSPLLTVRETEPAPILSGYELVTLPAAVPNFTMYPMIGTISGSVSQGQINSESFVVDETDSLIMMFNHNSGTIEYELVAPSGITYDKNSIEYLKLNIVNNTKMSLITIENPEVGQWKLNVQGITVIDESGIEHYVVQGILPESNIKLEPTLPQQVYNVGDPVVISAKLTDNQLPLTSAQAAAYVRMPDDTVVDTILNDAGIGPDLTASDGIYSGSFQNTSLVGSYLAVVAVEDAGSQISRESSISFQVSRSSSGFNNSYFDFGIDTDGDSLFNHLVIQSSVTITHAGNYEVMGVLKDSFGKVIDTATASNFLAVGPSTVSMEFDGRAIFDNRVNGPFKLSLVRLGEVENADTILLEEVIDPFTTKIYDFRQFQRDSSIFMISSDAIYVTDGNKNGRYEALWVDLTVDVPYADYYEWSVQLVDKKGNHFATGFGNGYLTKGVNTIKLRFEGKTIRLHDVNGPYSVENLLIYNDLLGSNIEKVSDTPSYKFIEFEYEETLQNGGFEIDLDSNKMPDGWKGKKLAGDKIKCNKNVGLPDEKILAYHGNCALLMNVSNGERSSFIQTINPYSFYPYANEYLYLNAFAKLRDNSRIKIIARIKYDNGTKNKAVLSLNGKTKGYKYFKDTVRLKYSYYDITQIRVNIKNLAGKAFIDAVSLGLLEPGYVSTSLSPTENISLAPLDLPNPGFRR